MNEQQIGRMESDISHLKELTTSNSHDIKEILRIVNQAKGGWRVGITFAAITGGVAGFLTKYLSGGA